MTDGRRGKDVAAVWAPLSEKAFLSQVMQLAAIRGWHMLHLRPGMTRDSWRTPISGDLGKGWPDLVLIRGTQVMFVELKAEGGKLTEDQQRVLAILQEVGAGAAVWYPSMWDGIMEVLR